jgi:hypothetical protein
MTGQPSIAPDINPTLADLQRALATGLAGRVSPHGKSPVELPDRQLDRARRALVNKRQRAIVHLLPKVSAALGADCGTRFAAHAVTYIPRGLLQHVDDAWAFALACAEDTDATVRRAAHDDLVWLRVRWRRDPRASVHRIAERRGPLLAFTHTPRRVVLRLPGARGRLLTL